MGSWTVEVRTANSLNGRYPSRAAWPLEIKDGRTNWRALRKKVEQTDAIFEQLKVVNPEADRAGDTLRISIDAKATVNIGPFSRRGKGRTKTRAAAHDFKPEATLTPFGIFPSSTTCGCTWLGRRSPATSSWTAWSSGGRRSGPGS